MTDIKKFLDQTGVKALWSVFANEVDKVNAKADENAADIILLKSKVNALEEITYAEGLSF